MEDALKILLSEQVKQTKTSVRELYASLENIAPPEEWMSMSTMERRLLDPASMSNEEAALIRDALKTSVSKATWIRVRRKITLGMRERYSADIAAAVNHGLILPDSPEEFKLRPTSKDMERELSAFYRSSPKQCREFWDNNLEAYTCLPNLAKACVLCGFFVKKRMDDDERYERRVVAFMDLFPMFQGVGVINGASPKELTSMGLAMKAAGSVMSDVPAEFKDFMKNREELVFSSHPKITGKLSVKERSFAEHLLRYAKGVTDYRVSTGDLLYEACVALNMRRVEWLLAYATSVFCIHERFRGFSMHQDKREFYDKGCSGFSFTDDELDYLCEFLYMISSGTEPT